MRRRLSLCLLAGALPLWPGLADAAPAGSAETSPSRVEVPVDPDELIQRDPLERFVGLPIHSVAVLGARFTPRQRVALVELETGQPLRPAALRRTMERLFLEGGLADLEVRAQEIDGQVALTLLARPAPRVRLAQLTSIDPGQDLGVRRGDPWNPGMAAEVRSRLRTRLRERGWLEAQVEVRQDAVGTDMRLAVRVRRGRRSRLGAAPDAVRLELLGAESEAAWLLARLRAGPLRPGVPLTAAQLERARRRATELLTRWGYPEARVERPVPIFDQERPGRSRVLLRIDAGRRVQLLIERPATTEAGGSFDRGVPPAALRAEVEEAGGAVDESFLLAAGERIRDLYRSRGRWFADVELGCAADDEPRRVRARTVRVVRRPPPREGSSSLPSLGDCADGFDGDARYRLRIHAGIDVNLGSGVAIGAAADEDPRRAIRVEGVASVREGREVWNLVRDTAPALFRARSRFRSHPPTVTPGALKRAADLVADYYRERGYRDVRFAIEPRWMPLQNSALTRELSVDWTEGTTEPPRESPILRGTEERRLLALRLRLQLGEQTQVSDVELRGSTEQQLWPLVMDPESATALVGQPLDSRRIEEARLALTEAYRSLGYPDVVVRIRPIVEALSATLIVEVQEGLKQRVGRVVVSGARRTRPALIRRLAALSSDTPLEREQLRVVQARLARSRLFRQVRVYEDPRGGERPDVIVEVEERGRIRGEIGGGISTDDGIRVKGGFELPNLGGSGAQLELRGQFGITWQSILSATGVVPEWRLGIDLGLPPVVGGGPATPDLAGSVSALLNEQFSQRSFTLRRFGANLSGRLTSPSANVSLLASLELRDRTVIDADPAAALHPADGADARLLLLTAGLTGLFDLRDDRLSPTRGVLVVPAAETTLGLGGAQFSRFSVQFSGYLHFDERWPRWLYLRGSAGAGLAFGWGGDQQVPIERRYRLGGSSLRGYRVDTVGPVAVRPATLAQQGVGDLEVEVYTGGDAWYSYSLEVALRPPAFGPLELFGFHDAGHLWLRQAPEGVSQEGAPWWGSLGFGVGIRSPVGPVRLALGFPIGRPGRTPQLHVLVGAR